MKFSQTLNNLEDQLLPEMAYGVGVNASPITKDQMIEKIRGISQPEAPIKFTAITDATYKKKNPFGTIYKVSQVEGLLNPDYAKRRQAQIDMVNPGATYVPGKSYGTHETGSIVSYQNKYYIQVLTTAARSPIFVTQAPGQPLAVKTKEEVASFIAPSPTPSVNDIQPEPEKIPIRKYLSDNIVAIQIDDTDYLITDISELKQSILKLVNLRTP